ncbi:MAG: hypothetical protein V4692_09375 [Bdellovibrionota bacterium]
MDSVIAGGEVAAASSTDVAFSTKSDRLEEHTIRKGNSAAHIYLDSGLALGADSAKKPYLFMAFPAGNSGVALWFKSKNETVNFEAIGQATAATRENGLNGAEIEIKTGVKSLVIDASILGSMRFIRDRELGIKAPAEVDVKDITLIDGKLFFKRKSLNGKASYLIEIEASPGTLIVRTGSTYKLVSETEVQFKLGGFTSETPLTPIPLEEIFEEEVLRTMNPEQLMAFSFLLYEEKLMAGAPRYHSKFGRDAIYSLRVLMNVMKPAAIEKILNSTIIF